MFYKNIIYFTSISNIVNELLNFNVRISFCGHPAYATINVDAYTNDQIDIHGALRSSLNSVGIIRGSNKTIYNQIFYLIKFNVFLCGTPLTLTK